MDGQPQTGIWCRSRTQINKTSTGKYGYESTIELGWDLDTAPSRDPSLIEMRQLFMQQQREMVEAEIRRAEEGAA